MAVVLKFLMSYCIHTKIIEFSQSPWINVWFFLAGFLATAGPVRRPGTESLGVREFFYSFKSLLFMFNMFAKFVLLIRNNEASELLISLKQRVISLTKIAIIFISIELLFIKDFPHFFIWITQESCEIRRQILFLTFYKWRNKLRKASSFPKLSNQITLTRRQRVYLHVHCLPLLMTCD